MLRSANSGVRLFLLLALLAQILPAHASTAIVQTLGEAFDLDSDELLYRETHCVSSDALTRTVIYRDEEGQLIAYKVLSYDTGPMTPSFVQHNLRSNDSVAVVLQRNEIVMTATSDGARGEARTVSVVPGANVPIVIDAGFDEFVRDNWDSLLTGQSRRFQFPFAAREMLVELRIESANCSYDTASDQCFSLEVDNWFLKLLSAPIELGYDAGLQRLTRFRGISNISDNAGVGLAVDIRYRYHDVAALDCTVDAPVAGLTGSSAALAAGD
jgi:hypothetical protein